MRSFPTATFVAGVLLAASASTAEACPYCDSDLGRQVAAGIFDASFFWNAALVGLPIPILLALAMLIRFAPLPGLSASSSVIPQAAEVTDERPA
jgi:hypothetical protein